MSADRPDLDPSRILAQLDAIQRELTGAREDMDKAERLGVLGTLAAMIAHEVRGIATKVAGNARLIELHADDPARVRELAARVIRLGLQAGRVAEAILAAAEEPLPGDCRILEVHRRALDSLPSEARSRMDDSGVDPRAAANIDPDALERVLVNLYLNSWRAVGGLNGTGRIRVNAGLGVSEVFTHAPTIDPADPFPDQCSARNIVRIRVRDDGPGVHPEVSETLFEPWQRASGGSGHGLGLALCRHLLGSVGGTIRFEHRPKAGAEVVIELPVSEHHARRVA